MGSITAKEKAKNFFEYMLALNNLVGKVVRDYRDFENLRIPAHLPTRL